MRDLGGESIRATLTSAPGNGASFGGIKVVAPNGWFAARPSGTEDVYKIYAESFRDQEHLRHIEREPRGAKARCFMSPPSGPCEAPPATPRTRHARKYASNVQRHPRRSRT